MSPARQDVRTHFKSFVDAVKPYEPGKPIKEVERELGLRRIIKLASNENPLGPSGKALRAVRRALADLHLYPESRCPQLVERLCQELGVAENQILCGNGSDEILELLGRGFLSPGDQVISSAQSFLIYSILTQASGAEFVGVPMKDHRYDLKGILAAITEKTRLIFVANPNNPTGTYVTAQEVESFLAKVPERVIVCFDEAYLDFVEAPDFPWMLSYVKAGRKNLILTRTFSKSYGLAGLRIGYGVGSPELIGYLDKLRQPFNVNSLAQAAAAAALDDRFFLWRTKRLVMAGRRYLYRRFRWLGLRYLESQANFVLVHTGRDGHAVFRALLEEGVIVRPMKAYGFDEWLRVTVGRRSQNAQFYRTLKKILRSPKP
ncbi:MAG: histidinol-phosphate transaminase [Candidatus Omnitrophota bacterium]|jgi:histidinol-phosphate aminotransferase